MFSIKTKIKLKLLHDSLDAVWYKLVNPLGKAIDNYNHKKDKRSQAAIKLWSDEYAMSRYGKVLIKEMIRYTNKHEEYVVATWCDSDYGMRNIRDYITEQNMDEDLCHWGCSLPFSCGVDRIERLTDLLKIELEKYKEFTCEYIVDKDRCVYCENAKDYKKTLIVDFDMKIK
jgi:hypothetical protein